MTSCTTLYTKDADNAVFSIKSSKFRANGTILGGLGILTLDENTKDQSDYFSGLKCQICLSSEKITILNLFVH